MPRRGEGRPLREGFTTGSAAAAGAFVCVLALHGRAGDMPRVVEVPTPDAMGRVAVPVQGCCVLPRADGPREAWAEVIKDGGDDPDATHGALIRVRALLDPAPSPLPSPTPHPVPASVRIEGGKGVGRVTLPGLPVRPGLAAINPAPRRQIALAVGEALDRCGSPCRSVDILIEVPLGFAISRRTMNARLGILGGISILGTAGIVRPFSHDAWRATVDAGLDVARALGLDEVGLCTGRRSERLLRGHCQGLHESGCVQMADLFAHALRQAAGHGFQRIHLACYGGKLVKMAQGFEHTHASRGGMDFADLTARLEACGMASHIAARAKGAVTARHVFELAREHGLETALARGLARDALHQARRLAGPVPELRLLAFAHDDCLMAGCRLPAGSDTARDISDVAC